MPAAENVELYAVKHREPAQEVSDSSIENMTLGDNAADAANPAIKADDGIPDAAAGLADQSLLHKIDRLFACNVGEYIDLPQLVVVGDQSSGKSSVLEGLVGFSFPRDKGLCTRYATQIVFKRTTTLSGRHISASIIPDENSSAGHQAEARNWTKSNLSQLDNKVFSAIIAEATNVMGLGDKFSDHATFSNDKLRLEISGPKEQHLSVIDVPGIFRSLSEGVTTKEDIAMVREMVQSYMENPRSLMLAVIPSNVDVATQEIIEMAKQFDPDGVRTLGVLTKPDIVDGGAEGAVLELLAGKRHKLKLGWHVVRNLGQKEMDEGADRQQKETKFFQRQAPWTSVAKDKCGIPTLRTRLQELLTSHIRREFPKVKTEVNKRLKTCESTLDGLGGERSSVEAQRSFLLAKAMQFTNLASFAVEGRYGSFEASRENKQLKLATAVRARCELFSDSVHSHGHTYKFDNVQQKTPVDVMHVRTVASRDDIEDMLSENETLVDNSEDILSWLKTEYEESRRLGLVPFDSDLVVMTMKRQCSNWKALSLGFISDVIALTHNFFLDLLRVICPDERVHQELRSLLIESLTTKYQVAMNVVEFNLEVETKLSSTMNHYYNDNLEKARQERMRAALESKSVKKDDTDVKWLRVDDLAKTHPMSNEEHVVQDIHDKLRAYYKVARKRFIDNVCVQGAEYHLIGGPTTPLKLFSPEFVMALTPEQLEVIAGEDASVRSQRAELKKELEDLKAGKKILI
ncbi:MAG: hypothetical protein M1828_000415 [Chrysothrix sp. TS-e1954]|nr:MAG: hypothetical protein M1828_000415 [Chrysothrix sp. TS-e1954]